MHTGDCVILVLHFQILDAVRRHGKLSVQCYGIFFCIVCICLVCSFGIRHDPLECSVQLVASGGKLCIGCIDRHEDALAVGLPLEYKLVVGDHDVVVGSVAEGVAFPANGDQLFDQVCQLIRLRLLEAGAQCVVVVRRFLAFLAPLASVINAGDARHSEEQPVSQRDMLFVGQDRGQPGDVVVVRERHQMLAPVNAPLLRTVLAVQGVCDLEHVHAVEAGVKSLVTLIIRAAVQHLVINDQVVVAEEHLADQGEARSDLLAVAAEPFHEIVVQAVRHVETEPVDAEFLDPHFHTLQEIVNDSRILQVQFDQFIVAFPALVPETVVVAAVAVKVNAEPVFVGRVPFLLLYIFKCPEAPSHVIENAVQHDLHIVVVKRLTDFLKVIIRSEAAVDLFEIPRIITVVVRLKDRIQDDRADPKFLKIFRPVCKLQDAVLSNAVIVNGRAAEADGVDLIKSFIISPHKFSTFLVFDNVTPVAPALSYIVPYFVRKQKQKHLPDGFSELTPGRCRDILKI